MTSGLGHSPAPAARPLLLHEPRAHGIETHCGSALTLHLKRFRSIGRRVHKLDAHVPFPATLDLSPFACAAGEPVKHFSELCGRAGASRASRLQLYGVVEHQGTFEGGHYVAFVRLGGAWYRMNDSVVKRVDEADVFKAQAFLLFYERTEDGA